MTNTVQTRIVEKLSVSETLRKQGAWFWIMSPQYLRKNGIQEAFLEYRPAVGLTADSLSKIILKFIQDWWFRFKQPSRTGIWRCSRYEWCSKWRSKNHARQNALWFLRSLFCSSLEPLFGRCLQSSSRSGRFFRCDGAFILLSFYLCCSFH